MAAVEDKGFANRPSNQQVKGLLEKVNPVNKEERSAALARLRSFDSQRLREVLIGIMLTDDEIRYKAAEVLFRLQPKESVEFVASRLQETPSDLRWYLCGLLADFGDERAVPPLVKVLMQDTDADIRLNAAFALGKIGDARALPALRETLQNDKGTDYEGRTVSETAADAIEKILSRQTK